MCITNYLWIISFSLLLLMPVIGIYGCWCSQTKEIKDLNHYVFKTESLKQYDKILSLRRINNASFIEPSYMLEDGTWTSVCGKDKYIYKATKNNRLYEYSICCEDKLKLCY